MPDHRASNAQPGLILDTNAVLDWLVFRDARMHGWALAIEQAQVLWLTCAPMREELVRTLSYAQLARWRPDTSPVLSVYDRWSRACPAPSCTAPPALQCADPDDQIFVDLGLAQGARWLVTHDRALLRLARATRRQGLLVVKPLAEVAARPNP